MEETRSRTATAPSTDGEPEHPSIPDFFIVGHPKSGTWALHGMLSQHPGIFMCVPKEPMYFCPDLDGRLGHLPQSLDEYLALFEEARPDQKKGECSTLYLMSRSSALDIATLNPDARIVAFFRDPVAFVPSFHREMRGTHNESIRDLRRAMRLEGARRQGRRLPRHVRRPRLLYYSDQIRYTDQLRRYHEAFSPEQVLTVIYEDYRQDNEKVVRAVLQHVGADTSVPISPVEANASVEVSSQALDRAVRKLSFGEGAVAGRLRKAAKRAVPEHVRHRVVSKSIATLIRPASPDSPELRAELRAWARPEVERFSEYLGRDLVSFWGYDR